MKFQTPRGTRDFLPQDMILRERVFDSVKKVFRRWGFDPFKTPAFEDYGLFTIKESIGDEESEKIYVFKDKSGRKLSLRFDQTLPFARQVVNNPQLLKPIRRYELSRVWRYEEVKRGRYREFWQCDCDIVGTESMIADAEVIAIILEVLEELEIKNCYMKINNRKILSAIMEYIGIRREKLLDTYRSIDKLDKIGKEGVKKELKERGIDQKTIKKIMKILTIEGNPESVLSKIKKFVEGNKTAENEIESVKELVKYLKDFGKENVIIDLSLVRGLDYYTSTIFEVMSQDKSIGSLAGGGRYDNLIGSFTETEKEVPAVGFGIGIERIINILEEREKEKQKTYTQIFVANINNDVKRDCLKIAQKLRKNGINVQTDIMDRNIKKQLDYANKMKIKYVIIVGPKELKNNEIKIRNMVSGKEECVRIKELENKIKSLK